MIQWGSIYSNIHTINMSIAVELEQNLRLRGYFLNMINGRNLMWRVGRIDQGLVDVDMESEYSTGTRIGMLLSDALVVDEDDGRMTSPGISAI